MGKGRRNRRQKVLKTKQVDKAGLGILAPRAKKDGAVLFFEIFTLFSRICAPFLFFTHVFLNLVPFCSISDIFSTFCTFFSNFGALFSKFWHPSVIGVPNGFLGCIGLKPAIKSKHRRNKVNANQGSMNDLPPEILTLILKCGDTHSLFQCRLVNRQWTEISSKILNQRSDIKIMFEFDESGKFSKGFQTNNVNVNVKKSENDLKTANRLFKSSKFCPVSSFYFKIKMKTASPLDFFHHKDWTKFTATFNLQSQNQNQNRKIKELDLEFECDANTFIDKTFLTQWAAELREVLFNKTPHLESLKLELYSLELYSLEQSAPEIRLFPMKMEMDSERNQGLLKGKLPHLKSICFTNDMVRKIHGILRDLLNAAGNLKSVESQDFQIMAGSILFLHSTGKPLLIKKGNIFVDEEFCSLMKTHGNSSPVLYFEELELCYDKDLPLPCQLVANFMSAILFSSKGILKKLKMNSVEFLKDSKHQPIFPPFQSLDQLQLEQWMNYSSPFFPPGIRHLDIFPAVFQLSLNVKDWALAFPRENSIPILPKLTLLNLTWGNLNEHGISVLSLMCPNLKHFKIQRDRKLCHFLLVGRAIWTFMKQLESLELHFDFDSAGINSIDMDSCFTGISQDNCSNIREIEILQQNGIPVTVSESKLMELIGREHPSILDMKDLKTLTIKPYSRGKLLDISCLFPRIWTWISQECAFKLMPNLEINVWAD